MQTALRKSINRLNTQKPERGPEHRALTEFVGHWKIEGHNGPLSPTSKNEKVSGTESWEWLDGEFFLVNRFDRYMGVERFNGLGWIGYDAVNKAYVSHAIDNIGFVRLYEIEVSDGEIKYNGDTERAIYYLSDQNNILTIHWEFTEDGKIWHTLCDLKGRRLHA